MGVYLVREGSYVCCAEALLLHGRHLLQHCPHSHKPTHTLGTCLSVLCFRFCKSIKVMQTPFTGPLLSYKLKPAEGWKVTTETSMRSKVVVGVLSYKAQQGE